MASEDDQHDAFAVRNLWRPSLFTLSSEEHDIQDQGLFTVPEYDITVIKPPNLFSPLSCLPEAWQLPSLDGFCYGPLDTSELPDASVLSTTPSEPQQEDEAADIWLISLDIPKRSTKFLTWETFQGEDESNNARSAYMSEWGPGAFDAALQTNRFSLQSPSRAITNAVVAKRDVAIKAFFDLGLGRSSVLFRYNERRRTFSPNLNTFAITGYSVNLCEQLFREFADTGATIVRLRKFAEKTYAMNAFPGRVALANVVFDVLSSLEMNLGTAWLELHSILQVQDAFERPRILIGHLKQLIRSLGRCRNDEQIASAMFEHCQSVEDGEDWLRAIMFEILAIITRPLLDRIAQWTGLSLDQSTVWNPSYRRLAFIRHDANGEHDESKPGNWEFDSDFLPSFISPEMGMSLYDTGKSLRLLQFHNPSHLLAKIENTSDNHLDWAFEWLDIDSIVEKAHKYEHDINRAIGNLPRLAPHTTQTPVALETIITANDDFDTHLAKSIHHLDQLPMPEVSVQNRLSQLIHASLQPPSSNISISFSPPISLVPALSLCPLLNAQSSIVKAAVLRLLFHSHHLRSHIRLHRAFFLFGDGCFVTRLQTALFDVDASTTEREKGKMRGAASAMGMRVGGRETWPPASSEVRLALAGILADCYHSNQTLSKGFDAKDANGVLPGNLSFTIRSDCPESIVDPHTLPALDFLRLSYAAPSPVDVVLSPRAIGMYDDVFKFLLRLIRTSYVVSRLPRSLQRRRNPAKSMDDGRMLALVGGARHFVETLTAHVFDRVISTSWRAFEDKLDTLERNLAEKADFGKERRGREACPKDIPSLCALHESTLSDIVRGCFLQNRQKSIRTQLDSVLSTVLRVEELAYKIERSEQTTSWTKNISTLATDLESQIKEFLSSCQDYASKGKAFGAGVEDLVRWMDWNGYYGICQDL